MPLALVVVNLLALAVLGVAGGMLARDCGRHALWGLLLAGYLGFFISIGCDLTEPVAAACLVSGILACRRGRPVLAGLLFAYGALTRETVLIMPLAVCLSRLIDMARRRVTPSAADLAWALPAAAFCAWLRPADRHRYFPPGGRPRQQFQQRAAVRRIRRRRPDECRLALAACRDSLYLVP